MRKGNEVKKATCPGFQAWCPQKPPERPWNPPLCPPPPAVFPAELRLPLTPGFFPLLLPSQRPALPPAWAFIPSELPFHTKPGVRFPPGLHRHSRKGERPSFIPWASPQPGPQPQGATHPTPNAYFPPSTLSTPWDTTRLSQLAFSFSFCVHGACVRKQTHSKCGFWMRPPPALPATRFPSLGSLHQTGNPCLPTLLSPSHFTCPRHSRRPLFLARDAPGSCCILPAPA